MGLQGLHVFQEKTWLLIPLKIVIPHKKLELHSYLKKISGIIVIAYHLYFVDRITGQSFLKICTGLINPQEGVALVFSTISW
jgi:hypothetical protein